MIKYLLFSALILVSQLAFSYTLEITEADIQEKVSAIMPIEKTKFFVKVKLSNPQVDLLKTGNRMAIHLNVETSIPNVVKGSGRGKVSGNLSYEASEGAFYFKDAKLESMEIDGLPQKYADKVTKIADKARTDIINAFNPKRKVNNEKITAPRIPPTLAQTNTLLASDELKPISTTILGIHLRMK